MTTQNFWTLHSMNVAIGTYGCIDLQTLCSSAWQVKGKQEIRSKVTRSPVVLRIPIV